MTQTQDRYILRFPESGVRQRLKARAALNRRSLNAEILILIEAGLRASKENAPELGPSEALDVQ